MPDSGAGVPRKAPLHHARMQPQNVEQMRSPVAVHDRDPHLRHHLRQPRIERLQHLLLRSSQAPSPQAQTPSPSPAPATDTPRPRHTRSAPPHDEYRGSRPPPPPAQPASAARPPPAPDAPRRSPSPSESAAAPRWRADDPTAAESALHSAPARSPRSKAHPAPAPASSPAQTRRPAPPHAAPAACGYSPCRSAATCPSERTAKPAKDPAAAHSYPADAATGQPRMQRHHARLAQRIDRRIRHLRKPLPEVRIHRPRRTRQKRQRRIVSHRPHRVFALRRHRLQDHLHVFARIAKAALQSAKLRAAIRPSPARPAQTAASSTSLRIRRTRVEQLQQLLVLINLVLPPDPRPASAPAPAARCASPLRIEIHQPRLRARNHQPILRHRKPARPQPIPIQRRAHHLPVAENAIAAGPSHGSAQSAW